MSARIPDDYDDFLQGLVDPHRRAAVKTWLGSDLGECAGDCGRPVRVMDGHVTAKAGMFHRECAPADA